MQLYIHRSQSIRSVYLQQPQKSCIGTSHLHLSSRNSPANIASQKLQLNMSRDQQAAARIQARLDNTMSNNKRNNSGLLAYKIEYIYRERERERDE
jgi:hypothetical protein